MRTLTVILLALLIGAGLTACGRKNLPHPPPGYGTGTDGSSKDAN